jgi:hypothetical protein
VTGRIECDKTIDFCLVKDFSIRGPIDGATLEQVKAIIDGLLKTGTDATGTEITLNSPGGSIYPAMDIGRLLRKH